MKLEPSLPSLNNAATPTTDKEPTSPPATLREQVKAAVDAYFTQLDGHKVSNLHELVMKEVEGPLLETVLKHCDSNQTRASKALGISRSTLRKKMTQYELD